MQLIRLVDYHRTLADPARLRILFFLANENLNGLELASRLGLSTPTVSHHMMKLREAGMTSERREGNSIRYSLRMEAIEEGSRGIMDFLASVKGTEGMDDGMEQAYEKERLAVLKAFVQADGRLKQLPVQYKKKLVVLEYLVSGFEAGRKYPEDEVNASITEHFEDYATIRREFIVNHFMYRDKGVYELNPREMWVDWRKLR